MFRRIALALAFALIGLPVLVVGYATALAVTALYLPFYAAIRLLRWFARANASYTLARMRRRNDGDLIDYSELSQRERDEARRFGL